jgi:diguanylate cyclase (GGDEF)-like protein
MSIAVSFWILSSAGESSGDINVIEASIEFFNLMVALVAIAFAIRILPSISRDIKKRSWLFLSLAALCFGVAEVIGVLKEVQQIDVGPLYEVTQAVFVVLLAIGFFYLYTTEHRENLILRRQSNTDDLTSLYTHGFFQNFLVKKVSGLRRGTDDLTVLFIDIDDFKRYNDSFGHQNGDYLLQKLARTIRTEARGEDIASRYGGEEFTLILNCNFETACRVAERLRAGVEEYCSILADAKIKDDVTVSIGLASFGRDADVAEKLVQLADARMYMAKRRGKNQVYTGAVTVGDLELALDENRGWLSVSDTFQRA